MLGHRLTSTPAYATKPGKSSTRQPDSVNSRPHQGTDKGREVSSSLAIVAMVFLVWTYSNGSTLRQDLDSKLGSYMPISTCEGFRAHPKPIAVTGS